MVRLGRGELIVALAACGLFRTAQAATEVTAAWDGTAWSAVRPILTQPVTLDLTYTVGTGGVSGTGRPNGDLVLLRWGDSDTARCLVVRNTVRTVPGNIVTNDADGGTYAFTPIDGLFAAGKKHTLRVVFNHAAKAGSVCFDGGSEAPLAMPSGGLGEALGLSLAKGALGNVTLSAASLTYWQHVAWMSMTDTGAFTVREHNGAPFYDLGTGGMYAGYSGSFALKATVPEGFSGILMALASTNTDKGTVNSGNRIILSVTDGGRYAVSVVGSSAVSDLAVEPGEHSYLLTVARASDQRTAVTLYVDGQEACTATGTLAAGPLTAVSLGSDFGSDGSVGAVFVNGAACVASGTEAGLASADSDLPYAFEGEDFPEPEQPQYAIAGGEATFLGFGGTISGSAVVIPDTVSDPATGEAVPVTAVGDGAFEGWGQVTSVTLPQSVTRIGARAFAGCTGLTAVSGAEALTEIGEEAFLKCFALEAAPLPERVASVGARAFGWCSGLRGALTLPAGLTALGEAAFAGCTGLTSVTGGGALTAVPAGAFGGCTALTTVALPGVTAVGRQAFWNCPRLAEAAFGTLSAIGRQAFYRCAALKALSFPASAAVGYGAFDGCAGLPTDGAGWRYADAAHTELLSAPAGLTGEVTVPAGVRRIHSAAFGAAPGVLAVTLPDTAKAIGDEAFYACRGATFRFASAEPPAVTGAWAFPAVTGSAPWTLTPSAGFYPQGAAAWEAVGASWQGLTLMGWARPGYRLRLK